MIAQFITRKILLTLWLLIISPMLSAGLPGSYTGSWFDLEFDGAGFVIEALADDRAVVY